MPAPPMRGAACDSWQGEKILKNFSGGALRLETHPLRPSPISVWPLLPFNSQT